MNGLIGPMLEISGKTDEWKSDLKVGNEVIRVCDVKDKDAFVEKMKVISENQSSDGEILYSEKFYEQIMNLSEDLYDCVQEFQDNMLQTYAQSIMKRQEVKRKIVDVADYGSRNYCFVRLSQAKLACKAAVERICEDVQTEMELNKKKQFEKVENNTQRWLDEIREYVEKFIDEFQMSFTDYISVYCDDEEKVSANKIRNKLLSKEKLLEMWNTLNLHEKIKTIAHKQYDLDADSCLSMSPQSYFELCTYDKDESGIYCYNMETLVARLNGTDAISQSIQLFGTIDKIISAREEEKTELTELQDVCSKFTVRIKQLLISMIVWENSES